MYTTTGNSFRAPNPGTDRSDGVVKLNGSAARQDYFQPPAWRADNNADPDLGSTGPVLLPSPTPAFVIGKQHVALLLDVSSLGSSAYVACSGCDGCISGNQPRPARRSG